MSLSALAWAIKQKIPKSSQKFLLVMLANYANENGLAYPSIERLTENTSQDRKTVIAGLQSLIGLGLISDTGGRTGLTSSVVVFQLGKQSQKRDSIAVPFFREAVPFLDGSSPVFGDDHNRGTVIEQSTTITRDAEAVYEAYPLKVGKPKAIQAIIKALRSFGLEHVLSRTEQFAKARNGDTAFMPHPTTWFNQERFNDDPATWKREDSRPTGAKSFDRNKGTCNEGKAAQYDLGRIQATEPVQDPGS